MTTKKSVSPSLQGVGRGGLATRRASAPSPPTAETERASRDDSTRKGRGRSAGLTIRFTVPGPLLGYRASFTRHRDGKYKAFKEKVLLLAMEQGFPNKGKADADRQPYLTVRVFWAKARPRIDWKNIYGAIEDALWYEDDAWVQPGAGSGFFCETGEEYAEVEVRL